MRVILSCGKESRELRLLYDRALREAEHLYIASAYLTELDPTWKLGSACRKLVSPRFLRQGVDVEFASAFSAPNWCIMMPCPPQNMSAAAYRSPLLFAKQVERVAKSQRLSDYRVLVELIELGIEARKQKEKAFFELAESFRAASDPQQAKRLGDELGRLVFGE